MDRQVLYVDGGCSGNQSRDMSQREMVSVVSLEDGRVVSEQRERGGSNNIAELIAVRDALKWCHDNGVSMVEIHTDSRNNFAWVLGKSVGKNINDRMRVLLLKDEIFALRRTVDLVMVWVPRERNKAGWHIEASCGL